MMEAVEIAVRVGAGVATLVGVIWAALRYMTRYYIERAEKRLTSKIDSLEERAKTHIGETDATLEKTVVRLDCHLSNEHPKLDARVNRLERDVQDMRSKNV